MNNADIPKLSRAPQISPKAKEFIEGAVVTVDEVDHDEVLSGIAEIDELPWEAEGVREDVQKNFLLRLPEPTWLKLKYIAENTKYSMHQFCLERLMPEIEDEIGKLLVSIGLHK